jgi:hypothetical protein
MTLPPSDTSPEAEAALVRILRAMPPDRRLQQAFALTEAAREFAKAGLRSRYPDASPEELHRRFADLVLGRELARRVYGPGPEED